MNCNNKIKHAVENAMNGSQIQGLDFNDKKELKGTVKEFSSLLDSFGNDGNRNWEKTGKLLRLIKDSILGKKSESETLFKLKCKVLGLVREASADDETTEYSGINKKEAESYARLVKPEITARAKDYTYSRYKDAKLVADVHLLSDSESPITDEYFGYGNDGELQEIVSGDGTKDEPIDVPSGIVAIVYLKDPI